MNTGPRRLTGRSRPLCSERNRSNGELLPWQAGAKCGKCGTVLPVVGYHIMWSRQEGCMAGPSKGTYGERQNKYKRHI